MRQLWYMRVPRLVCVCVLFPGVFLHSRVTGACPVTTDLIMRVDVRTTTTTTKTITPPFSTRPRHLNASSSAVQINDREIASSTEHSVHACVAAVEFRPGVRLHPRQLSDPPPIDASVSIT